MSVDGNRVRAGPDVLEYFNAPVASFSVLRGSFNETMPSDALAEADFDIWLNGSTAQPQGLDRKEVMVWIDTSRGLTPGGNPATSAVIGGQRYSVWERSTPWPYYALVLDRSEQAGTVNLAAVFGWLESVGLVSPSDVLSEVDFGWEIRGTGGTAQTFTMDNYSLTAS